MRATFVANRIVIYLIMKNILTFTLALLLSVSLFAKEGDKETTVFHPELNTVLAGQVVDFQTGEALVGVTVKVAGSERSFFTDLEGNFEIKGLMPGTYDLDVNYVSYQPSKLKKVEVLAQEKSALKVELKQ